MKLFKHEIYRDYFPSVLIIRIYALKDELLEREAFIGCWQISQQIGVFVLKD